MTYYGIRDEYSTHFGRQQLTVWSQAFMSNFEGWATELPRHDGFMVKLYYGDKIRVECPAPRTDDNWVEVDTAIRAALDEYDRKKDQEREQRDADRVGAGSL